MSAALFLMGCEPVSVDAGSEANPTVPQVAPEALAPGTAGRRAAQRFVAVVEAVEPVAEAVCREETRRVNCDFQIVIDDTPNAPPNAFQTVDDTGRPVIAFTVSMIATVRNADELAFVMGHEAGHHIAGHLSRRDSAAAVGSDIFAQIARRNGVDAQGQEVAARLGAAVGARSFSQEFELEAAVLGTRIAARSGYNPLIGAEFFSRIPDSRNRFFGTHPPNARRAEVVRQEAQRLGF